MSPARVQTSYSRLITFLELASFHEEVGKMLDNSLPPSSRREVLQADPRPSGILKHACNIWNARVDRQHVQNIQTSCACSGSWPSPEPTSFTAWLWELILLGVWHRELRQRLRKFSSDTRRKQGQLSWQELNRRALYDFRNTDVKKGAICTGNSVVSLLKRSLN